MIAALLKWFKRWDVEKAWPKPEASGEVGGMSWRKYHTGAWG